jgi:hypothetical protein
MRTGWRHAASRRWASSIAVASSCTPSARTTNSSPPRPRDGVARPYRLGEARSDAAQQLVAGVVAERVVDHLEAVEVEQEDGRRRAAAAHARERAREAVAEQLAIRQPGQRVVQRAAAGSASERLRARAAASMVATRPEELALFGLPRAAARA